MQEKSLGTVNNSVGTVDNLVKIKTIQKQYSDRAESQTEYELFKDFFELDMT